MDVLRQPGLFLITARAGTSCPSKQKRVIHTDEFREGHLKTEVAGWVPRLFPSLRHFRVAFTHPELLCEKNAHNSDEEAGCGFEYIANLGIRSNSKYAYEDGETSKVILER